MENATMKGRNAISGSLAQCFVTLNGQRYNMMSMISFTAKASPNVVEVPILGQTAKGHKMTSFEGTWEGTAHYNTSVFREVMYQYQKDGTIEPFDIQVTTNDPTAQVGSQTVILHDCLFDEMTIAKFDADADYLDEDLSGTFDSWEIPVKFDLLDGAVI